MGIVNQLEGNENGRIMGRKIKTGFHYYSIETDRYQDMRIKRLKKEHGCNGIAVYDKILCEIYRVEGSFIEWDESTVFDVAEYFGLKETQVNEIVNYCCYVGLFDRGLLASERVLTSSSIQLRFIQWSKLAQRKNPFIPERIRIINEEKEKIPEEIGKLHEEIPQSKEKESKEKEMLSLPWDSPEFLELWEIWKKYKKYEHKFSFKSILSEQAQLKKLLELSGGAESIAKKIILQSIENGWKGFFELKNGTKNNQSERTGKWANHFAGRDSQGY